jgi:PAS domain-containing protein
VSPARRQLAPPLNARSYWAQHALSMGAVALALGVRWFLDPVLGDRLAFITVFMVLLPLVVIVRPGPFLTASLLGCAGTLFLFIPPRYSFRMDGHWTELQMLLFIGAVGAAAVTAWLSGRARQRGDQALRGSEEKHRLLVEGVEDYAVMLLDSQGRVSSWNIGAERIKGFTAEEIIGVHFSRFYPKEAAERGWPQQELEIACERGRFEDE